MKSYEELIKQSFEFPTQEFHTKKNQLHFYELNLAELIQKYGTPLRVSYLPRIKACINNAKKHFQNCMKKFNYPTQYLYCYCTKSAHFSFILKEVLKCGAHIETSSAFDIPLLLKLYEQKCLSKNHFIIANGYKTPEYVNDLCKLIKNGFKHCIPVLDNTNELALYQTQIQTHYPIGLRLASEEEPNFEFYTSRLGIRYSDIIPFYQEHIKPSKATLKLLHFFIHTGIKDTEYFWSELNRFVNTYCKLKKQCKTLNIIDIGGGFPIKNNLYFEYDYVYMIEQIVENIHNICKQNKVELPHIMTEFGTFTVGETGAIIYEIMGDKKQNDRELWYMINGSLITQLPDVWGLNHKYLLLPINYWNAPYQKVNLGGLTCDSLDYYSAEAHLNEVFLPVLPKKGEIPLYVGFFHTGAYQENLAGYGGLQHCLIPTPQHIIVSRHEKDKTLHTKRFRTAQTQKGMLNLLGY